MKNQKTDAFTAARLIVDLNLKSHKNDPFVVRKVEAAKKALAGVDLSVLKLSRKS